MVAMRFLNLALISTFTLTLSSCAQRSSVNIESSTLKEGMKVALELQVLQRNINLKLIESTAAFVNDSIESMTMKNIYTIIEKGNSRYEYLVTDGVVTKDTVFFSTAINAKGHWSHDDFANSEVRTIAYTTFKTYSNSMLQYCMEVVLSITSTEIVEKDILISDRRDCTY